MLSALHDVIKAISAFLYQPWFVPLILLIGGFCFTIRSRFIQVR